MEWPPAVESDSEIEDHDAPLGADEYVGGLDVAMELTGGMECLDAFHELPQGVAHAVVVHLPVRVPRVFQKVRSTHQLHREEDIPGFISDELVEVHEIRVLNVGERAKFLFEAVDRRRIGLLQSLQCAGAPRLAIENLVDASHPTLAEQVDHLISGSSSPSAR
jgi:hypothetical protein